MSVVEIVSVGSNLFAAGCGLIAGYYWVRGARAHVEVSDEPDESGMIPFLISETDGKGRQVDVLETAAAQSHFNGTGAYWGAATAVMVAIGQIAGLFH